MKSPFLPFSYDLETKLKAWSASLPAHKRTSVEAKCPVNPAKYIHT